MWIKILLIALAICSGRLELSCDFRIDAMAYLLNNTFFLSSGDRFWLPKVNQSFPNESWKISEFCPGLKRADVAFRWGTLGNASCSEQNIWKGDFSLMLMEKRSSKCEWCYLLHGKKQTDWIRNGTILNSLKTKVELEGCEKLEALGFGTGYSNRSIKFGVAVIDGRFQKWTCGNGKLGLSHSAFVEEINEPLDQVYSNLPKRPRLVSLVINKPESEKSLIYFIYDDGSFYWCRLVKKNTTLPIACTLSTYSFSSIKDRCYVITTTTTTTTPTTTSTPSTPQTTPILTTSRGKTQMESDSGVFVFVFLGAVAFVAIALLFIYLAFIAFLSWKRNKEANRIVLLQQKESDDLRRPLLAENSIGSIL